MTKIRGIRTRTFLASLIRSTLAWTALAVLAPCAMAQLQFDELFKQNLLPASDNSTAAVALGDVDGDGDLDLVFGNNGGDRLYLNDGTGAFTDATAARMPINSDPTSAVALGDVDGDGDVDLVFGNNGEDRLYVNDGTGTFTDAGARMPLGGDDSTELVLGDVDGDGDLDLVLGLSGSSGVQNRLYLNDGTGTFNSSTHILSSDETKAVALGDVDGDGDLDLVFGNVPGGRDGAQNRLYFNDGTGIFTDATAAHMPPDNDSTQAVTLGDLDGDGDLDLVFGNNGGDRLYLNDGTGTFTDAARMPSDNDATRAVALGDVDGDGDNDLVFGNLGQQNRLYLNDATGTFSDAAADAARLPRDSDRTYAVALGDLDGDGDNDLVFGNFGHQNRLYLNDGTGTFTDATAARMPTDSDYTWSVALGDLDGDGDNDLLFGGKFYLNDGTGTFTDATAARIPPFNGDTWALAVGDVDGDGDNDLVFGNFFERNRLYLNDGTGTFTDATAARMPPDIDYTVAVALGDVDGDGDLDLVLGNPGIWTGYFYTSGQNRLYLNDGTGTFTDATAAQMPTDRNNTSTMVLGDVDGDGDLDLVFGNDLDNSYNLLFGNFFEQNRLYLNDGTGTFTDATAARMPSDNDSTRAVALGDLDGDGDLDLVFGNLDQQYSLYLNDGTGTFTDATTARMPSDNDDTRAVALGDMDGDGDNDLVFGNLGRNRLYLNLHRELDTPLRAILTRTFAVDFYAKPGYGTSSHTAISGLNLALAAMPLTLPQFPWWGQFHVEPVGLIPLPPVSILQSTGMASLQFTVPLIPSLVGHTLYVQGVIVNDTVPWDVHFTNYTAEVIIK